MWQWRLWVVRSVMFRPFLYFVNVRQSLVIPPTMFNTSLSLSLSLSHSHTRTRTHTCSKPHIYICTHFKLQTKESGGCYGNRLILLCAHPHLWTTPSRLNNVSHLLSFSLNTPLLDMDHFFHVSPNTYATIGLFSICLSDWEWHTPCFIQISDAHTHSLSNDSTCARNTDTILTRTFIF